MTDAFLRRTLRRQLSAYVPAESLGEPFTSEGPDLLATTFRLVDAAVRSLSAEALEKAGHPESAAGLRELPEVTDRAQALKTMMAVEKVAHRTKGPGPFFRAIGGVPSTSVLVVDGAASGSEERLERALTQLAGAVVRVVGMAKQMGLPADALVEPLRAPLR